MSNTSIFLIILPLKVPSGVYFLVKMSFKVEYQRIFTAPNDVDGYKNKNKNNATL